mmetsp:Transcript_29446/g.69246  ORF Transcript_29446/g.69246 Transcript_29446/m.69246 type:complete len:307 (+) Transcript_29446:1283-2203(+)
MELVVLAQPEQVVALPTKQIKPRQLVVGEFGRLAPEELQEAAEAELVFFRLVLVPGSRHDGHRDAVAEQQVQIGGQLGVGLKVGPITVECLVSVKGDERGPAEAAIRRGAVVGGALVDPSQQIQARNRGSVALEGSEGGRIQRVGGRPLAPQLRSGTEARRRIPPGRGLVVVVVVAKGHDLCQVQNVANLVEANGQVPPPVEFVLGVVCLIGPAKWQGRVKDAHGRDQSLQPGLSAGGGPAPIAGRRRRRREADLAVFVDQFFEMRKGVGARRGQGIENKGMHQHALHPFDQSIPPVRGEEIIASA